MLCSIIFLSNRIIVLFHHFASCKLAGFIW